MDKLPFIPTESGFDAALRRLLHPQETPYASELTLGLLHRFNNLFTGVMFLTDDCLQRSDVSEPLRERLLEIAETLRLSHSFIDRVVQLHIEEEEEASYHEVDSVLAAQFELFQLLLPRGTPIHQIKSPQPLHYYGTQRALFTILLHVFANAGRVLPAKGGATWVKTEVLGGQLVVSVRDNGPGFTSEVLARAFEPFFTSGAEGGHPGLGLYRARELARAQGGDLKVANYPEGGAIVTLTLPQEAPDA